MATMTRIQAWERTQKLLAVAADDSGATDNERAVAKRKAQKLVDEFELDSFSGYSSPPRVPKDAPKGKVYVHPDGTVDYNLPWAEFIATGRMNDKRARVIHYRNPANWKVELDV